MIVVDLLVMFILGMSFGALSVADEMQYRLDKCVVTRQDLEVDFGDCKENLKVCELRNPSCTKPTEN